MAQSRSAPGTGQKLAKGFQRRVRQTNLRPHIILRSCVSHRVRLRLYAALITVRGVERKGTYRAPRGGTFCSYASAVRARDARPTVLETFEQLQTS